MENQEKIIVFRHFPNQMEAHIARTKLEAYGIPCFLSEENFAALYPLQHMKNMGIRLHLFEKDEDKAREILNEMQL